MTLITGHPQISTPTGWQFWKEGLLQFSNLLTVNPGAALGATSTLVFTL